MDQLVAIWGQSNALGYNVNPSELPSWYTPNSRVQIWSGSGWSTMIPGVNTGTGSNPAAWGPEVAFAYAWLQDNVTGTLYITKTVKGSTGLAQDASQVDWSPNSTSEMYDQAISSLLAAKSTLISPHTAIVWVQGEQDAADYSKAVSYAYNYAQLKAAVSSAAGYNVWVDSRISTQFAYNDIVNNALGANAIDTANSPLQSDLLHYSGAGQIENGLNLYAAYSAQTLNVSVGGSGDDIYIGSYNADSVSAMDGNDIVVGGPSADWLHGNKGNDTVLGGSGNDTIYGGQDNDRLIASDGDDFVNGNLGYDFISGGNGNDWLYGGQQDDTIYGGAGNDFLAGDAGNDTLYGGSGTDAFYLFANAGIDSIKDFNRAEGDYVWLEAGTSYSVSQVGSHVVIYFSGGYTTIENTNLSSLGSGWIV